MLTRRGFLGGSLASMGVLACGHRRGPALLTKGPSITHGVQSGDPRSAGGNTRANVWARCDEPARMLIEWDTDTRFANPQRVTGPVVGPDTDHCGIAELAGLPVAQTIVYRVKFSREGARGDSAWATGTLRTPKSDRVRVAWTGDTCGQGYGRNPEWGGLRGFEAIRNAAPDVFVNSGDLFYADSPLLAERTHPDGRIWKNITNERVARVAQELDDFRARLAYNLEDDHFRALAAEVPVVAQWDDHETRNNWFPGQILDDARYTKLRDAQKLSELSKRAIFEWMPITAGPVQRVIPYGPLLDIFVLDCRTFRSPNSTNVGDEAMLGAAQTQWLIDAMRRSTARWKIVACDQPIALAIDDGPTNWEGWANNDPGEPRGREKELAQLLRSLRDPREGRGNAAGKNTIWITADVHYAAAHHFDPARGKGVEFEPFWEFVAGPINAGNFGPNPLDPTLGPEVKFQWGTLPKANADIGPGDGFQNFGTIDATRESLTIALRDLDGNAKFELALPFAG